MKDECQMMEFNSSINISNKTVHHVRLVVKPADSFNSTFQKVVSLRTLRLKYRPTSIEKDDKILWDFRKFGSLRTFDARGRPMTELPSSIGNLKHLRYLNLSDAHIKQLLDSICSLLNLQTLILDNYQKLERLPQKMMYLRSLRHVFLKWCRLIEMPPKIRQLTNLKTLIVFVVGKSIDCSLLAELKCLNLGGELCIEHLERVGNPMNAKEANLVGKQNLSRMELNWEYSLAESESESQEIDESESQENIKFESSENIESKSQENDESESHENVLIVAAARIEVVVASEALSAGRFWAVHGFEREAPLGLVPLTKLCREQYNGRFPTTTKLQGCVGSIAEVKPFSETRYEYALAEVKREGDDYDIPNEADDIRLINERRTEPYHGCEAGPSNEEATNMNQPVGQYGSVEAAVCKNDLTTIDEVNQVDREESIFGRGDLKIRSQWAVTVAVMV
ncbi:hypothetical protein TEA_026719 [Camellia sinensis var. sinensis]|uniref:Disease resistance R13L4/SHOC-2-like LRR domain-containing protein n=1 Tax=Camellia sinensis var. sinensis TaxID=542762 RepID=A0A4S4CYW5_CAMSN|nr:hypothetical protein TEA_026719 [Camellia sinensis var. sinensis]